MQLPNELKSACWLWSCHSTLSWWIPHGRSRGLPVQETARIKGAALLIRSNLKPEALDSFYEAQPADQQVMATDGEEIGRESMLFNAGTDQKPFGGTSRSSRSSKTWERGQ
ncbi:hypothetical protein JOF28_000246 [Leucobacter exalbidus]|uniref:Uncharacterized protein n=1 Tax=Leucobacter exalbidus TaxID=662960 RepID=A0A940PTK7_9MICO|nr:hypothetical protein [Leucobacter exalbidus]